MSRSKRSKDKPLLFFNESVVNEIMMNFSLRSLATSAWLWRCLAFLIVLPILLFLVLNVAFQFLATDDPKSLPGREVDDRFPASIRIELVDDACLVDLPRVRFVRCLLPPGRISLIEVLAQLP